MPNIGLNVETVETQHVIFTVQDVGYKDIIRRQLCQRTYYPNTRGIIFVVDSNDRDLIVEARQELGLLLQDLPSAALLVFAHKQDLPNAMTASEVADELGLGDISDHPWYIEGKMGNTGMGLYEGLDWMSNLLK